VYDAETPKLKPPGWLAGRDLQLFGFIPDVGAGLRGDDCGGYDHSDEREGD
jgi:hypothetical protein